VARHWTTRCCSAFALIALVARIASAQQQPSSAPLGLFPADLAWDLPLNNLLEATPVFKNDRGYFPISDHRIAAYDVRNGTLLWIAPGQPQFELTTGEDLLFEIESDAIVALRDDTGVEAWRFALQEPLVAPLVCRSGWLIASARSGAVLALRASDGALIWRQELGALIHTLPTIADDRVYVPMADGRIVAMRVDTGEPIWERRLGGTPNEITATADFVYAGSTDDYFYALRARDGLIAWRWPTGGDVVGRAVVDNRLVYFVSFDNVLRALDKNTGNLRWKRPLPLRPTRGLVVMGANLIASGISPSATTFAMKDGTPLGSIAGPGELATAPHVVTGDGRPLVILVSRDLQKGTILRAVTRAIEPAVLPMTPLPNPVPPPVAPEPLPADEDQPADTDPATEDAVMP
jgi:outer membrane protein assembly factor BamB